MAPADNVPPSFLDEMTKQFITKTDKSTEWTYNFPPIEDPDKEQEVSVTVDLNDASLFLEYNSEDRALLIKDVSSDSVIPGDYLVQVILDDGIAQVSYPFTFEIEINEPPYFKDAFESAFGMKLSTPTIIQQYGIPNSSWSYIFPEPLDPEGDKVAMYLYYELNIDEDYAFQFNPLTRELRTDAAYKFVYDEKRVVYHVDIILDDGHNTPVKYFIYLSIYNEKYYDPNEEPASLLLIINFFGSFLMVVIFLCICCYSFCKKATTEDKTDDVFQREQLTALNEYQQNCNAPVPAQQAMPLQPQNFYQATPMQPQNYQAAPEQPQQNQQLVSAPSGMQLPLLPKQQQKQYQ